MSDVQHLDGEFSLYKSNYTEQLLLDGLQEIEKLVRLRRSNFLTAYDHQTDRIPVLASKFFSVDGSLICPKRIFENHAPDFFKRSRRAVLFRGVYHLRGIRYLISTNPTFEVRQKLATFRDDFYEGIKAIEQPCNKLFKIAIADYIKNAILTVLNAFIYEEKTGRFKLNRLIYQKLRSDGVKLAQSATNLYYSQLTNRRLGITNDLEYLKENAVVIEKLIKDILDRYEYGSFSSRHMNRPEAAHPQIVTAAAVGFTKLSKFTPDTIIGLPSGSTELSMAYKFAQRILAGIEIPLLLAPISLHSIKTDFDQEKYNIGQLRSFLIHHKRFLEKKNVLIVDDNSSTGRTVQILVDCISVHKPSAVVVAVAEADTRRSRIDVTSLARDRIASFKTYTHSVSVLPVSRVISPKTDIKELLEKRKTIECVKSRYLKKGNDLIEKFIGKVYVDLIRTRTSLVDKDLNEDQKLSEFRKTFLSNFWPCEVKFEGKIYHSVEHAYQAMKFGEDVLATLTDSDLKKINTRLEKRGQQITKEQVPDLFILEHLNAGTSKIAANQLRIMGYVRQDWDDVKVKIMAKLLVQKFSKPEMYEMLKKTNPKYLIEGNDWGDTFWGYDNNRGRNILGRMLMILRAHAIEELNDVRASKMCEVLHH